MEQRRFHRVKFSAPMNLLHHEMTYRGRVDNISLRGAMVSADECLMIPPGDVCTLSVFREETASPIVLTVEVVHSFFSMVGVKFVAFSDDAEQRLYDLMQGITDQPEKLRQEWEVILEHRADQRQARAVGI